MEIQFPVEFEKELEREVSPLVSAMGMGKGVGPRGSEIPSPELAQLIVSHLCFRHNHPSLWKFLHSALSSRLLSPIHVLALLTSRVIPQRRSQPEAYRLYLELLSRYALSFDLSMPDTSKLKILESVDAELQLSQTYGAPVRDLGHAFVLFFFNIVTCLIDSSLDDWGLQITSLDKSGGAVASMDHQHMDIDCYGSYQIERNEHHQQMRQKNSFMAIEVLERLTESTKAIVLLRLVYLNMPEKFDGLIQRLQFLEADKLIFSNLKSANQLLERLSANVKKVPSFKYQLKNQQLIRMLVNVRSNNPVSCCNFGSGSSSCWVPFDIFMENAMDGKQLLIKSAIVILTEKIYTLKVYNQASWQETFLALWLSALRLVQRERDPPEGPIPHLEARLCVLLSIVPLAIANVLEDEAKLHPSVQESGYNGMDGKGYGERNLALISSLQLLGNFSGLLCPPASITTAANRAAAKAASFISISKNGKDGLGSGTPTDSFLDNGGNMRHLIVEACISRNLIDTSAYFWPGYLSSSVVSLSDITPSQKSPWSTFMEGAPLTDSLADLLFTTPASSLAEIERLYHIALNGSADERPIAAKILCGASLSRGWNIQEHVVNFVVKLLSPLVPPGHIGPRSHLIDHMRMLSAILFGASSVDTVHILSLHGVIPEVAASLMPLCETFGSLTPTSGNKSKTGDEPSIYMVFSLAFLFLLRLWKFYRPPIEQFPAGGMGPELTLEYLLLLRNSRIVNQNACAQDVKDGSMEQLRFASDKPVYIDYYPKLRAWYCQNGSCIASTLPGLCSGNPVHQVANKILSMIYLKMTKSVASSCNSSTPSGNSSTPSSSNVCGSPVNGGEDACQTHMLSAWEVLEAVPFVLEAILTACDHGTLSSRDLITGLRDLIDFLPASLAVITSYLSAEITRGLWKPVPMNGTDWPSPAATLLSVESEMKELLASVGVHVPIWSSGASPLMLPLPVAAFVSLTITFKLTKNLEYIHAVVGPALENCASACAWPTIIGSLWAQKVQRWHNFIVVSCSRSVFGQSKEAVVQILRSCFTSYLGSLHNSNSLSTKQNGIDGLLGNIIATPPGVCPFIAPGIFYLRSCRLMPDIRHVNDMIVELVTEYARESAARWASSDTPRVQSSQASLPLAAVRAKEVATLGASLLCVSGGFQLVQELYRETIPTWFLSLKEEKPGKVSAVARIIEGYAMAYMLVLSGSFVWGVGDKSRLHSFSRRGRIIGIHMNFLARVLERNILVCCDPLTWKAYVCCLVSLVVSCAPAWIQEVKPETLQTLATGLRGWHECELALSLLERGGISTIGFVAELIDMIN
ncbi:hypothetical protein SLE2022_313340 [Rubroshorea leprosula]